MEFDDIEVVDMDCCFVVAGEGIIGIMRPVDDFVVFGMTPNDDIGVLEYGEL